MATRVSTNRLDFVGRFDRVYPFGSRWPADRTRAGMLAVGDINWRECRCLRDVKTEFVTFGVVPYLDTLWENSYASWSFSSDELTRLPDSVLVISPFNILLRYALEHQPRAHSTSDETSTNKSILFRCSKFIRWPPSTLSQSTDKYQK